MQRTKTVHIHTVIEAKIPFDVSIRDLGLGLAGSKILTHHPKIEVIPEAEILTWWVEDVVPTTTHYVNCPKCGKIELVTRDCVTLDGKPLCIHCSADFQHGDLPTPRTPEDLKAQLGPRQ